MGNLCTRNESDQPTTNNDGPGSGHDVTFVGDVTFARDPSASSRQRGSLNPLQADDASDSESIVSRQRSAGQFSLVSGGCPTGELEIGVTHFEDGADTLSTALNQLKIAKCGTKHHSSKRETQLDESNAAPDNADDGDEQTLELSFDIRRDSFDMYPDDVLARPSAPYKGFNHNASSSSPQSPPARRQTCIPAKGIPSDGDVNAEEEEDNVTNSSTWGYSRSRAILLDFPITRSSPSPSLLCLCEEKTKEPAQACHDDARHDAPSSVRAREQYRSFLARRKRPANLPEDIANFFGDGV